MKGYVAPLYVLPFDHRSTFAKKLLDLEYPVKDKDKAKVTQYKKIVFDAFREAQTKCHCSERLAILVDEEFGLPIIKEAKKNNLHFYLPVEKSSQDVFKFEYGTKFKEHILKYRPTFVKALIRYNPSNKKDNILQRKKMKQLVKFCEEEELKLMIEPLIPATSAQLKKFKGDTRAYDKKMRPELARQMVAELYADGIVPDVWKIEAMENKKEWKRLGEVIRDCREHRNIGIIVLGRGEDAEQVNKWIKTAASSGLVNGFAVGRTVFFKPLQDYRDKKITRDEAVSKIATNYVNMIGLWRSNHK